MLDAIAGGVRVVHIVREVVGLAGVVVDVAVMPVGLAPQSRADGDAGAEGECRCGEVAGRVRVIGRVRRGPGPVHDRGVVARHLDHLRVRRLDLDDCRRRLDDLYRRGSRLQLHRGGRRPDRRGGLDDNVLLRCALELPLGLCACAQALNGGHELLLL